jgi:uncharacterized membrane protein
LNYLHQILLSIHILAGFTALSAGLVPMLSKKGSRLHRQYGKVFYISVTIVCLTVVSLSFIRINYFLLAIAFFSYYLTITGYRYPRIRERKNIRPGDKLIFISGAVAALLILSYGMYLFFPAKDNTPIILTVFGSIFLLSAIPDVLNYVWPSATMLQKEKERNEMAKEKGITITPSSWLFEHLSRMIGAYSAVFTAFAVTNFRFLPPVVNWLLPTIIGVVIINITARHYRKKIQKDPSLHDIGKPENQQ